ncbi:ABC transporter substrate-binding protein [Aminobacter sp. Piv2-1]|uniref:ABC transporter substrate-binding protein n=1 Tax=Aminobacter sp. Piv2-1 TaxID=3031122 RepID=UPI00309AFB48
MKTFLKKTLLPVALLVGTALAVPAFAAEDVINVTNLSYRTGPFAATGTPLMNGQRDYMQMLNERDGGVNGVKLNYDECETGYNTEKGAECYEKTKATSIVTQPWSTGITLQVLPKSNVDKVPILAPGYGFSPMTDGKVFQWAFNPPATYWDGASMILKSISDGNVENLKGKKVVLLHLDAPYGKEPIPLLKAYADKYGFTFLPIPVGVKEMQNQSAQWLQIRRERPDFVLMWGWGAMNVGAVTEAVKTKFPMDKFVGIWWSGHDGDMKSVGEAGKGYRSLSWSLPDSNSQVMQDIKKYVVDAGKSQIGAGEFDWVFYQRGVLISMFTVEGIKAAQEKFGTKVVNAEQLRWGLENLKLDEARLASIGMAGMIGPFSTACNNHAGHAGAWMLQWDGTKFVKVSDLLSADQDMIAPLVEAEAKKYAEANAPWPVNEECKM